MNYEQTKSYLGQLNRFGIKLGLERIERLLALLGNPEKRFRSILVGGTSGKGSTCVMLSSILSEAGYKVGLFVKPHLFDFRERISVNGQMISERDFARLVEKIKPLAERVGDFEKPTFFEFLTALAFEYFKEKRIDIAVLEVGLGGRLDATNVVDSEVSIITNVSLEHTNILGGTVEKITKEKAGIIKENGILITGVENPKVLEILKETCERRKAKFIRGVKPENALPSSEGNTFDFEDERIFVPLGGRYQLKNIGCVLAAIRSLKHEIPLRAIKEGLKKVKWPGRFEVVEKNPTVLLDGAKDPNSIRNLLDSLDLLQYEKLYAILGISKDKQIEEISKELSKATDFFILTKHNVMGRGMSPEVLAKHVSKHGKPFMIAKDVKNAVKKARSLSKENDLILVTGSLFTVAEAREMWFPKKAKMGRELEENVGTA
ncbi:MAG: bifunctional folylpolyglutamate synthase/dihydrofolate synthase [Candidatus Aenigmarchaeota archaeon]|nr:bifunctional folylpolyglutamate synthase/dihydrofolate synthase [Candidatus Aenigmarchaeota archaeon]